MKHALFAAAALLLSGAAMAQSVPYYPYASAPSYAPLVGGTVPAANLPSATSTTLGAVSPDGTTIGNVGGAISVTYGAAVNTSAQGNDSRIVGALQRTGDTLTSGTLDAGSVLGRTLATRAGDTFNVADSPYLAKCDGTTNDDAAINAAVTAALGSAAYTNSNAVTITGPSGGVQKGCVINSINLTGFTKGTGSNTRPRVVIRDMTLLCTGAGNICLDGQGADLLEFDNISLRGDSAPNTPEIGLAVGGINGASSAWHSVTRSNFNNEFSLAALYNRDSEANTYLHDIFSNVHSANGPIGALGTVTGGSAYTNGTYLAAPLTGGAGSGALATIVVAGGAVTTVTVTYQGRDYVAGDTLSAAPGGTGSGFSVPVASVTPYAVILDGQGYWRPTSAFATQARTPDTWGSMTLETFVGTNMRTNGSGDAAMWISWGGGVRMINSYMLNSTGPSCLKLFDNGVTKAGIPGPNWGLDLEFNCEGAALGSAIQFSGANATPILQSFRYRGYHQAAAMFAADANVTAPAIRGVDLDIKFGLTGGAPMFAAAKNWTVSGRVQVPSGVYWNAPSAASQVAVTVGGLQTPPGLGPVDVLPGAALAISCARQLVATYAGALCQVTRASDSTTRDLYPNATGNLDKNAFTAFCGGTTCSVSIAYDQSGNAGNCTQTVAASQPPLTLAASALGGRAAMGFGDQSAYALSCPSAAPINDLFAAGGYASMALQLTSVANAADQFLRKTNGGGGSTQNGYALFSGFVGTSLAFNQGANGSVGAWTTATSIALAGSSYVYDLQYSTAALSNAPTFGINGNTQTQGTPSQPTGTITSDASYPLLIGNNAASAGNRGFNGSMAEVVLWKVAPSALQIEAVRRNQANFYAIAGVN